MNRLLEEVLLLRSATYAMLVRATPEFASRLEVELHEILMLLRTELRVPTDFDDYYVIGISLVLLGVSLGLCSAVRTVSLSIDFQTLS